MDSTSPEVIHKQFIKSIVTNPMEVYIELSTRLQKYGIVAEFPEFAPIIHFLKQAIHKEDINAACESNIALLNFRRHADLALWHVSQSEAWYQYGATLRAIFTAIQFLDTYQRTIHPELNDTSPFYHEYRYMYYFDYMINKAPDVVLIPTYENITATSLVLTRGPPIFFVGVSVDTLHVDEFKQTPAEFFIHDINHGRRQYETSLRDYEANWQKKMSLTQYYEMQITFLNKVIRPMISLKDTQYTLEKGIRQLIKIILFEILHEDAQPAYPRLVCRTILRGAGHGEAYFQVVYTNPNTGLPDIRKIKNPGGGILAFVKYKLRYGFLDESLEPMIVEKEYRTTDKIVEAALFILNTLGCETVPDPSHLKALADNMSGQNPPVHPNHLGEEINVTQFTGKRPSGLSSRFFEVLYETGVPWSGLEKKARPLEKRTQAYNAAKEAEETAAFLAKADKLEAIGAEAGLKGGTRKKKGRNYRRRSYHSKH